jgi:quinol monooxygenase YgiN
MIIITGTIVAKPETLDELLKISLEHVRRSREEPGCVSHDVHVDAEKPARLFFFERWADRDAVTAHFAVRESRQFVKAVNELAAEPPVIQIYTAEPMSG